MGGLVVRSACHYGAQQQHDWPDLVRHVLCLGSPHLGADLEKGVNVASWALSQLPEPRALASFLNAVYHFVATTAAPGAVGMLLGDRLVRPQSASGAAARDRLRSNRHMDLR